jgi:hypothetical protein
MDKGSLDLHGPGTVLAAAVMRKLGTDVVVLEYDELAGVGLPDVSRSFSLGGDTVTIRLHDDDAAGLDSVATPFSWPSLRIGEKAGVLIAAAVGVFVLATLVMLAAKLWMWLL